MSTPTPIPAPDPAQALRAFNRFWTRELGVLHEHLLDSRFTLAESRLLWELAERGEASASALAAELRLDLGYVSRLLAGLRRRRLLTTRRDPADGRRTLLALSASGRRAFATLDAASQAQAEHWLAPLAPAQRQALVAATGRLHALLSPVLREPARAAPADATLELGPPQPGDLGWVVARHGALYAAEQGLDQRFEGMVAGLVARFAERFDPHREACWIARRGANGTPLGSVFLIQARDDADVEPLPGVAQLRMLLLEPEARGLGLGRRLVDSCTQFARGAGYARIRLWTQSNLLAARRLYAAAGYRRVHSEPAADFGAQRTAELWEQVLGD